ncbi:MAG: hypothetical protein WDN29_07975 [Methylovirgula sp.]
MTATKTQSNGYGSILNSLREHKDRIDRAIEALEALQDSPLPATDLPEKGYESPRPKAEPYAGLQFIDAVTKLMNKAKGPLTTAQITEALLKGGFSSDSEHPKKVVAAQLHRYADNGDSGIVKAARGLWSFVEETPRKSP